MWICTDSVSIWVCLCVCVWLCMSMCVCVCVGDSILYTYVFVCICIRVWTCVCMHMCGHVYDCVWLYGFNECVCAHIYIHWGLKTESLAFETCSSLSHSHFFPEFWEHMSSSSQFYICPGDCWLAGWLVPVLSEKLTRAPSSGVFCNCPSRFEFYGFETSVVVFSGPYPHECYISLMSTAHRCMDCDPLVRTDLVDKFMQCEEYKTNMHEK